MFKNRAAAMSAAILALALVSPTAVIAAPNYTPVAGSGTECVFDKYLVTKKDAEIPNITCHFTIEPGKGIPYSDGHMEVIDPSAHNVDNLPYTTGTPVIKGSNAAAGDTDRAYVVFAPGDATTNEENKVNGETVAFMNNAATGTGAANDEKYAKHQLTIDFSGVKFTEPGVYRYIVREVDPNQQALTADKNARTLDVYVTDQNEKLVVSSYVLHTGTDAPVVNADKGTNDATKAAPDRKLDTDVADKSSGFTNQYLTWDSTFRKEVTGNQGSKDKYFKIHVIIGKTTGATVRPADRFQVDMSNAETAPRTTSASVYQGAVMKTANSARAADARTTGEYVTGQDLLDGHDFYLKDGESIIIRGIPDNALYTYTETKEDYKETDTISANDASDGKAYADAHSANQKKDTLVGFTNTRNGIIPTGIMIKVMLPALMMAAGLLGAIATAFRKKKNA